MKARLRKKMISTIFSFNKDVDRRAYCAIYAERSRKRKDHWLRCFYSFATRHRKQGITVKIEVNKKDNEKK